MIVLLLAGAAAVLIRAGEVQRAPLAESDEPAFAPSGLFCQPPADFAMPRVRRPDPADIRRTPVTRYTLALSWSPGFCARGGQWAEPNSMQCSGRNGRFGFILHGLWPETQGRNWPQYCRPARAIPSDTLRQHLCMTPSPDLLQHEWERHGTCMSATPEAYLSEAARIYDRVVMPDMAVLIRDGATAGAIRRAFVTANPGLQTGMIAITGRSGGWLEEVRLCLDRRLSYTACPAGERGLADGARVRIQPLPPS